MAMTIAAALVTAATTIIAIDVDINLDTKQQRANPIPDIFSDVGSGPPTSNVSDSPSL